MNHLGPATTNYLLEISLEDLHQESRTWLSEIEFWRTELLFFQKIMKKRAMKLVAVEERNGIFSDPNYLIQKRILDQFEQDIREHEKNLKNMIQEKVPFNEQFYRDVHKNFLAQFKAFDLDFKQYRMDLYSWAEKFF